MKGFLIKKLAGKQRAMLTQLGEALRGAEAAGCGLAEFAELRSLGKSPLQSASICDSDCSIQGRLGFSDVAGRDLSDGF